MSRTRFGAGAALVLVLATLLSGYGSKSGAASGNSTGAQGAAGTTLTGSRRNGCAVVSRPPAMAAAHLKPPTAPLARGKVYKVMFTTNCGSFTIRLDQAQSPHATASFVALTRRGFFDRTIFHRIAVGFVIQGGDPTQSGEGGPGYTTVDAPPATARYTVGVVAMAKTSLQPRGAAGSQFFVVTGPDAAGLPPDYAIIGKVSNGLGVVERIGKLGNAEQKPTMVVEILKASVAES